MPQQTYSTKEIDAKFAARDARLDSLDSRVTALEANPPDPPQPTDVIPFGVSFGGIGYTDDAAKRGRMMDDLIAMGARSLRMQWWRQQPCIDAVEQARAKGLVVLSCVMPDYSNVVRTRAEAKSIGIEWANLLGSVVKDAEWWNEPDLTTTWTPEAWAQAAVGFWEGIEASQYPDVRVWQGALWTWKMNSGSTTEGAYRWWERAYAEWKRIGLSGLPGFGCSGHMYGDMGWNDPRNSLYAYFGPDGTGTATACIRALMDRNGDEEKPIRCTEGGNGNPSAQVAAVDSLFNLRASGVLNSHQVYCQWDDAAGTFGMRPAEGQAVRAAYNTYKARAAGGIGRRHPRGFEPGPTPFQRRGDVIGLPDPR